MKTLLLAFVVLLYTAQAANLTPKVPTQKVLAQINNLCVNAIRLYQGCDFTATPYLTSKKGSGPTLVHIQGQKFQGVVVPKGCKVTLYGGASESTERGFLPSKNEDNFAVIVKGTKNGKRVCLDHTMKEIAAVQIENMADASDVLTTFQTFEKYIHDFETRVEAKVNYLKSLYTGRRGPAGPKGDKGEKGIQGPPGVQGVAGPKGDTGDQGERGETGVTGADGKSAWRNKGDYEEGVDYHPGDYVAWHGSIYIKMREGKASGSWQKLNGPAGPHGRRGPRGYRGDLGPQGYRGIQGIQGEKGDKGDIGVQGITGPQGIQGNTGIQGVQGIRGVPGQDGADGIDGGTGPKGPTGLGYDELHPKLPYVDPNSGIAITPSVIPIVQETVQSEIAKKRAEEQRKREEQQNKLEENQKQKDEYPTVKGSMVINKITAKEFEDKRIEFINSIAKALLVNDKSKIEITKIEEIAAKSRRRLLGNKRVEITFAIKYQGKEKAARAEEALTRSDLKQNIESAVANIFNISPGGVSLSTSSKPAVFDDRVIVVPDAIPVVPATTLASQQAH